MSVSSNWLPTRMELLSGDAVTFISRIALTRGCRTFNSPLATMNCIAVNLKSIPVASAVWAKRVDCARILRMKMPRGQGSQM
jgi:hypothetical protein